mmetsp:Transcript_19971/g.29621  ORF Transcript_19971/g.29621 Transcript_19971/m.29621 type:complete len:96 (-) Transcript_19971:120-407(-)
MPKVIEDDALVECTLATWQEFDSAGVTHKPSKSIFLGARIRFNIYAHVFGKIFRREWITVKISNNIVNRLVEIGVCFLENTDGVERSSQAGSLRR